jgi:hypothetical protein
VKQRTRNLFLVFALCLLCGCTSLSDIRTEYVKKNGASRGSIERGKKLLAEVEEATGGKEHWLKLKTMQVDFSDEWPGFFARVFGSPWNDKVQALRLHSLLGGDNGFLELLDEKSNEKVWGLQNWMAYERKSLTAPAVFNENKDIRFWIPTIKYFLEFPFRISEAQIVTYAGETTDDSKTFELVFATWETFEPNSKFDQYLLWINSETKLIERIQYTVRDIFGFVKGAMLFQDYQTVNGITFPMLLKSVDNFSKDPANLHTFKVEKVQFNVNYPDESFFPARTRTGTK